jgi:hypothetical protein
MNLRGPVARRAVIFGGPVLFYFAALFHPRLEAGETRFLVVHLAFPFLICLLAWTLVLLVDGVGGGLATLARALVIPFAVAYTAFSAVDGIALGAFAWKVADLPEAGQPTGVQLINSVSNSELERPLYLTAALLWLAAALAVVAALRRRAPVPALVLLVVGAALFAKSHVEPWGPAGMAAFLAGVVWLELRPTSAKRPTEVRSLPFALRRRT